MSITSNRTITVTNYGDVANQVQYAAAPNLAAPGEGQPVTLATGDNAIAIPSGGTTPTALTIVKPAGNTVQLKLKGNAADTGVLLHLTDPDSISLGAGAVVILNAAAPGGVNIRLVWS